MLIKMIYMLVILMIPSFNIECDVKNVQCVHI